MNFDTVKKGYGYVSSAVAKCRPYQTNKSIMKTCEKIGDDLATVMKSNDGTITTQNLEAVVKKYLRNPKKTLVAGDANSMEKFAQEIGIVPAETINQLKSYAGGAVVSNPKTNVSLYYVNTDLMKGADALNSAVHEAQHLLHQRQSFSGKLNLFLGKHLPKPMLEKISKKTPELQSKYLDLQWDLSYKFRINKPSSTERLTESATRQGLLEHINKCSFESKMSMQDMEADVKKIIKEVMLYNESKQKSYNMRAVRKLFQDEARSYKAGGNAATKFGNYTEGSNSSELTAEVMDLAAKKLKQVIKQQRITRLKNVFSGKPKPPQSTTFSQDGITITLT